MTWTTIPGALDLDAMAVLYGRDQYRPTDPEQLGGEIRRLARSGLKPLEIARAMRLTLEQIERILERGGAP
jgi:hypothetical protein